jgi:hypothetical protein
MPPRVPSGSPATWRACDPAGAVYVTSFGIIVRSPIAARLMRIAADR